MPLKSTTFTSEHCQKETLCVTNHTVSRKFVLVLQKLSSSKVMLITSNLSIIETMKQSWNCQSNFGELKTNFTASRNSKIK